MNPLCFLQGQEVTEEFEDQGHSETARNLLKKYEVGICDEKDPAKLKKAKEQEKFPPIREQKGLSTWIRVLLPFVIVSLAIFYAYYKSANPV